jgi:hypothetical protein
MFTAFRRLTIAGNQAPFINYVACLAVVRGIQQATQHLLQVWRGVQDGTDAHVRAWPCAHAWHGGAG